MNWMAGYFLFGGKCNQMSSLSLFICLCLSACQPTHALLPGPGSVCLSACPLLLSLSDLHQRFTELWGGYSLHSSLFLLPFLAFQVSVSTYRAHHSSLSLLLYLSLCRSLWPFIFVCVECVCAPPWLEVKGVILGVILRSGKHTHQHTCMHQHLHTPTNSNSNKLTNRQTIILQAREPRSKNVCKEHRKHRASNALRGMTLRLHALHVVNEDFSQGSEGLRATAWLLSH